MKRIKGHDYAVLSGDLVIQSFCSIWRAKAKLQEWQHGQLAYWDKKRRTYTTDHAAWVAQDPAHRK